MREQDARTVSLIGEDGLQKLQNSTVAVIGLGGVGSVAVEALARSGIGRLYLYDKDTVAESNRNRQLQAMKSTVGKSKAEVLADRIADIDPAVQTVVQDGFVTPQTDLPLKDFDFVVDAVDNVTLKLHLAQICTEKNVPLISVTGTGNKLDPSRLQISDLYETNTCPLCRVMRNELKKRGVSALTVVWSDEKPLVPDENSGTRENGRPNPGSMMFVPASAGLLAASYVVRKLLRK
ncbi:MAG: tRNA threonylcarbamoyladenosine dehydratase [Clostridia bacterium]|nr:tRNA threonylcarbamoyladenosine dehydratase [Clostridia bacterium]